MIEILTDEDNACAEAPTWDPAHGRLIWTDNRRDFVYQYDMATRERTVLHRGMVVRAIVLNTDGDIVFGTFDGLSLWQGEAGCRTIVSHCNGEALRLNDMIADPQGRIYGGTFFWGPSGMVKTDKLILIGPDGSVRTVDEGIELANGLALSPDNRTLYFADSAARKIYAYEVDLKTGDLTNRSVFADVPVEDGLADGLTVDTDGHLWCALWYGSQIVRYDPDGAVERRIDMPVRQVASLIFAGDDLTDLYVTTAGQSWPSNLAPAGYDFTAPNMGGSLYRIPVEIQGKLDHMARFQVEGAVL